MNKIVEYTLVTCEATKGLEFACAVNRHIEQGWQPYGSVSVQLNDNDLLYYYDQPMVKYEDLANR